MERNQLIGSQCVQSVRVAGLIAALDLEGVAVAKNLDDGTDLANRQAFSRVANVTGGY
jgi:hypothetical protein